MSKALVQLYPALSVTSLSYNVCSVLVMIVGLVMYGSRVDCRLQCRECQRVEHPEGRHLVFVVLRVHSLDNHLFLNGRTIHTHIVSDRCGAIGTLMHRSSRRIPRSSPSLRRLWPFCSCTKC